MPTKICFVLPVFAFAWLMVGVAPAVAGEQRVPPPAIGPRGPVGPGVPLSETEGTRFAKRVTVAGRMAAAVQAACERAVKEGTRVVFLPSGEYVFEAEVKVPGGLTVLGEGSNTVVRPRDKSTHLFGVDGDRVRFTRLELQGADTTSSENNDTYGISAYGKKNVRIDHCELVGFSYATTFGDEATAQVDHCSIHHNLREGLGYGVALYSGAYVLITDNDFSQNRHSLASNGTLDWSSGEKLGKFLHKPGRKTHWEFVHNRAGSNDLSVYELCAVDTHPGMDGTFVVEGNLFENLRDGIGIRDGAGLIRANLFLNLRGKSFRPWSAISIAYGTHNGIPVENAMPHDIEVSENTFLNVGGQAFVEGVVKSESARPATPTKYVLGQAENISIGGKLIPETHTDREASSPLPLLWEMGEDGVLPVSAARPAVPGTGNVAGTVVNETGKPVAGAAVLVGERVATTDKGGGFSFAEVSEAAQFVAVSKIGFELATPPLRVRSGQRSTVAIRLLPDRKPPAILNARLDDLTHNSATFAWETSEPATGEVEYRPQTGQGDAVTRRQGDPPTTTHGVPMTDLQPATVYRVRVKSKDVGGNETTSNELTFTTAPTPDPAPPVGWSCYLGGGKALWGRTAQEAHTGKFSSFLKGVAHEHGSLNIALVAGESDGYSGAKAYSAEPGAIYRYSFWAKGDFQEVGLLLMTWNTDASDFKTRQSTRLGSFNPMAEWKGVKGEFTMPAEARKFVVMFQVYRENLKDQNLGVLYVDDLELGTVKGQVLRNGGVENDIGKNQP